MTVPTPRRASRRQMTAMETMDNLAPQRPKSCRRAVCRFDEVGPRAGRLVGTPMKIAIV